MKRWAVVVALLTMSLWAVAQTGVAATPTYTTANGSGLSTSTGTAFVVSVPSQPSMVTPMVHLGAAAPVVGATNATPGNIAGAMNSTMANVPAMPPIPVVAEYSTQEPVVMLNQAGGTPVPIAEGSSSVTVSGTINPGVRFNTGVGSISGSYPAGTMAGNQVSLGELARRARAGQTGAQAHLYTNQDIQRIEQAGGGSVVGGVAGTAVGTAMPGNNGVISPTPGAAPAVAQPTGTSNQPVTSPGVAQPVPSQQPQTQPTPPMSQMQPGGTTAASQAETGQAASTAPAQQGQLPRTDTVLPLMAIVGFAAAAAGLLAR